MSIGGQDKETDEEKRVREAALYDPDSVFHDFSAQTTTGRIVEALSATEDETAAPEPDTSASLYARSEKKRPGGLTKEMIKRMADRAEQAAKDKQ